MLKSLIEQLVAGKELSAEQVKRAVEQLVAEEVSTEEKADFLGALARKGESVGEITAFAKELRDKAVQPPLDAGTRRREIVDVCGTGGDQLGTFNISTSVSLVVSAAGVAMAKHGNRAITSRSGSADVLETLGVPIELSPEEAARALGEVDFAFFFAPKYHPAFKHIGPARKLCAQRGQRTVFNFLGPLLNPARPSAQLIGVPRPELCEPIARVLQSLGVRRGMVVCGRVTLEKPTGQEAGRGSYLDEVSTLGETTVAEFYQDRGFNVSVLTVESFPTQGGSVADLAGSDRTGNATMVRELLSGKERGPKRDAVLLNAGAALFVAGAAGSLTEGWDLAAELIDSGRVMMKLKELVRRTE